MLRDSCVGIEAIYYIVHGSVLRSLDRKIGCAAAAEDQDIQLILHMGKLVCVKNLHTCSADLHALRASAGEDCCQLHVSVLGNCALNALS